MDFLLNERSLHGQFENGKVFLESLGPVMECIKIIHAQKDARIYKTETFGECMITTSEKLCALNLLNASDGLVRFKIQLDREIYDVPKWDEKPAHDLSLDFVWEGENVTATALAEAAIREDSLISFRSDAFIDRELKIFCGDHRYDVNSVHTPQYLLEKHAAEIHLERQSLLNIRYRNTRIDCESLEEEYGADRLNEWEFNSLISTLDKFVKHESWESIGRDDGLEYKKYTPSSPKDDRFRARKYDRKTIMKFRFDSKRRVFGYRKGDRFRILRIEIDHSMSDKG